MRSGTIGLALLLGVAALGSAAMVDDADARPKAAARHASSPPALRTPVPLKPEGLHWGMRPEDVATLYDRVFDQDYVAKYKQARISEQASLDAELRDLKASYRRRITFGNLPTGIDQTPLKGEYNYKHDESMMTVARNDITRHLFFVGTSLWKIYDEIPLKQGGEYGASYKEAVAVLQKRFGVSPRVMAPDFEHGRPATEVDWADATTHVRAIDRSGENVLGLVLESRATADLVAAWRASQKGDDNALDPLIASATRGGAVQDPNAHAADAYTGRAHSDPSAPPPPPRQNSKRR